MISKTATYQVEMSTDGKHRVIVTIEDPAGTQAALAWARATYSQLVKDEDLADQSRQVEQQSPTTEAVPECTIHHRPLSWVEKGRRGPFWSCHEKNEDGSWCIYTHQP